MATSKLGRIAAALSCALFAASLHATELQDIVAVTAGMTHACALTTTGGVKCWGGNTAGQLGDGTVENRPSAVDVVGLGSGVAAVVAGYSHTCALTSAGAVKCWGWNGYLQTGIANQLGLQQTPVAVPGLEAGVVALSSSPTANSTCALMNTGAAKCWGDNGWGQLGRGTRTQSELVGDVTVVAAPIAAIAIGSHHACALDTAGGVKCWGNGNFGELGNGNFELSPGAVNVVGLASAVAAVDLEDTHTCALTASGGVKCWGMPADSLWGGAQPTPQDVPGATSGIGSISVGLVVTCAVTTGGGAKCWGRRGTVGDGTGVDRMTPVDVLGLTSGVVQVAAGGSYGCAVTVAGTVKCWGGNFSGQLGNRDVGQSISTSPVSVEYFIPQAITFGALADRDITATPFAVAATASSGLSVSFTSITPWTCTVSGTTVSLVSAGVCAVAADQAGDVTWDAAPQVVQFFDVIAPPPPQARLANLSTRAFAGFGDQTMIAGFVIGGSSPKTVVMRALGPTIQSHGLVTLHATHMRVFSGNTIIGSNGYWPGGSFPASSLFASGTAVAVSGFAPNSDSEGALIGTLPPGAYTLTIHDQASFFPSPGLVLVEVYELDKPDVPLLNISTRAFVGTEANVMIAGFVVAGDSPLTVAITGKGPSLANFGVAGSLANPTLTLVRQSDGAVISVNDNWEEAPNAAALQASGFAPAHALESAMLVTLPPGAYTAILSGVRSTGIGLVEVFRLTN